ncbi:MAG: DUF4232 domain-containing protein [Nocardioidaceae bacterium]
MKATGTLVLAAVLAAVCTACGSQPTTPTAAHGSTNHTKATASPASGGTTRQVPACSTADLKLSLGRPDGAAGSTYVTVVLTNVSGRTCTTGGFGGVSYVGGGDGTQVGAPASRQGNPAKLRLAPGKRAVAVLQEVEAGNYDSTTCRPVKVDGLRVYPPNQTASLYVAQAGTGCRSTKVKLLTIRPYKLG